MIIIAIADIHSDLRFLSSITSYLEKAHLVLLAGDITNFLGADDAAETIKSIRKYNSNILAVTGNCDSPQVAEYLKNEGLDLNCRCVEFEGITFTGLNGSVPSENEQKAQTKSDHFRKSLKSITAEIKDKSPVVFVSHHPARNTAVDSYGSGNTAIAEFIKNSNPLLAISGHIHESPGKDTLGNSTLVNPGPFRESSFAKIEIIGKNVKSAEIMKL